MKELTAESIKTLDVFGQNPHVLEAFDNQTQEKRVFDNYLVCENKELGLQVCFILAFGYWKLTVTERKKSYDNTLSQTVKVKYQEEAELFLKMISLKYQ